MFLARNGFVNIYIVFIERKYLQDVFVPFVQIFETYDVKNISKTQDHFIELLRNPECMSLRIYIVRDSR